MGKVRPQPFANDGDQSMKDKPTLTDQDHENLDAFLGHVLDAYKAGDLDKTKAIAGLTQMIAALDLGDYDEVRSWLEQGKKLIHM